MFKQRLIMALILIPLVLGGIYYLPSMYFSILVLGLVGLMISEWQQFIELPEVEQPYLKFIILFLGVLLVMKFWTFFIYLDVFMWVIICIWIFSYPKYQAFWGKNTFMVFNCWILLGVFSSLLIELQMDGYGKNELVSVMLLVWAADTGAYFVGRQWGQHKMIPLVSPGKSWEGLFGGVSLALIVGALETIWMNPFSNTQWFLVVMATVLISVIGDLWMSALKRRSHVKDTGHLIPGHGGVLDRLDSMLAALPVFYFVFNVFKLAG